MRQTDVRFCRERKDKAEICSKLGITHFVDDRLEVLNLMSQVVRNLYLFDGNPAEVKKFASAKVDVLPVSTWAELTSLLLCEATKLAEPVLKTHEMPHAIQRDSSGF